MNRLKYLALAALVAFAACDEGDPVDPTTGITGTITGTVTAEGQGVSGVAVTLSGPSSQSATTGADGSYTFNNVEGGAYTVSISNIPADYTFQVTSQAVTITTDGQTAQVSFAGQIVRTASISGQVTASGDVVSGVTVTLSGDDTGTKQTNADGEYSFTGLQSGSYTVSIENPNEDVYTFSTTEQDVTLSAGESEVVNFAGTREGGGDGSGEEASVVIQGITNAAGGSVPTNALFGTIVARANIDEGDQDITSVTFSIGDNDPSCTQTFGGAAVDGQQSGDNFTADCTINTAAFNTETGVPNFLNGATTLTVEVETAAGDSETATINIGLANADRFAIQMIEGVAQITPENTAISSATGNLWWGGDVEATVVEVMYSGRTAARATATFATGTETDLDPDDGFTFTFTAAAADAGDADFIGTTEAMNQNFIVSGVTEGGANIGASTLTTQNYDDVAPTFTDAESNLTTALNRWINGPFTFTGVAATDAGVMGTDIFFSAGPDEDNLEAVESGAELEPTLTNNTYILAITARDDLENERTVFHLNADAAGTTDPDLATLFGVDLVPPTIDDNTGPLDALEAIDTGNETIQITLDPDDRSGFGGTPLNVTVEGFSPSDEFCYFGTVDDGVCTPDPLDLTFQYSADGAIVGYPPAANFEAYYLATITAEDRAMNESDPFTQWNILDHSDPTVGGIGFDAILTAGEAETFTAPIADNLDIDRADFYVVYGGPALLMSEEDLGEFGPEDGYITSQLMGVTVNPFIGWVQDIGTGVFPGVFRDPTTARADVFDFAFGETTAAASQSTPITATIDAPMKTSYNDASRDVDGQITAADLIVEDGTICNDVADDGCTNPTSTTVSLEIRGATGELEPPFSTVYIYADTDASGVGTDFVQLATTSVSISDDGANRIYTYSAVVSATDFEVDHDTQNLAALAVAADGTALWVTDNVITADD